MSNIFAGVILLLLLELGLALVFNNTAGKKAKYCEYDNMHITIGETVSIPGKCMLATCLSDSISAFTCAAYVPDPGCHESKIDYTKPFPECCPQYFCE